MRFKQAHKLPRLPLVGLLFLALCSMPALAEEQFLVSQYNSGTPKLDQIEILVRPSQQPIDLVAGFYEVNPGAAPVSLEDPEGSYRWTVECSKQPGAECAMPTLQSNADIHGETITLPPGDFHVIRIVVTHVQSNGESNRGVFLLQNADQVQAHPNSQGDHDPLTPPGSGSSSTPAAEPGKKPWGHHRRGKSEDSAASPAASGSSGGRASGSYQKGSVSGGGYSASYSSSKRGTKKRGASGDTGASSAYDRYYNDMAYGGGGASGASTGARGYNRDNVVPVISCVSERGANGAMRVRCEDSSRKVLRIHAKAKETKAQALRKSLALKGIGGKKKAEPSKKAILTKDVNKPNRISHAVLASRK